MYRSDSGMTNKKYDFGRFSSPAGIIAERFFDYNTASNAVLGTCIYSHNSLAMKFGTQIFI